MNEYFHCMCTHSILLIHRVESMYVIIQTNKTTKEKTTEKINIYMGCYGCADNEEERRESLGNQRCCRCVFSGENHSSVKMVLHSVL